MTPQEIKQLRKELRCNPRELAAALGIELKELMEWESEERFPTRRYVRMMEKLREGGPENMPRLRRRKASKGSLEEAVADGEVWAAMRKVLVHPELRARVLELAADYEDPGA